MSPKQALNAAGRTADWLDHAEPNHRLNTLRYELPNLNADDVCDLAILALDGWFVRVSRANSRRVRVDLREPRR